MPGNYKLDIDIEAKSSLDAEIAKLKELVALRESLKKQTNELNDSNINALTEVVVKQDEVSTSIKKQKTVVDELTKAEQRLSKAKTEQALEIEKVKIQTSEQNKINKEQARQALGLISAYDKLSKQLVKNKKAVKDLLASGKSLTKSDRDLIKSTQDLDKKLKDIDKTVGDNQRNVGNYGEVVGLLGQQFGIVRDIQRSYNAAQVVTATVTKASSTATGGLSKALKILKTALISSGVGAIVVALGSLVSFLTQTQRGADGVSSAFAGISAAVSVVVDRLSRVGEGLSLIFSGEFTKGFDLIKNSFKGITLEISEEAKEATELEKRLQRLRDAENALIVTQAERRNEIEKLRLEAKEEGLTLEQRISLLKRARDIEDEITKTEIELAKERADIAEKQLALGESTADEVREAAELRAKVIELETENFKRQRTIQSELLGLIRKEEQERKRIAEEKAKQEEADRKKREEEAKRVSESIAQTEQNIEQENFAFKQELLSKEIDLEETTFNEKLKLLKELNDLSKQALTDQAEFEKSLVDNTITNEQEKAAKLLEIDNKLKNDLERANQELAESTKSVNEDIVDAAADALLKQIEDFDKVVSSLDSSLDQRTQKRIENIDKEIALQDKALERQLDRAERGQANELELQQEKAAQLELEKQREFRAEQRRQEILAFYNLLSSYAKEDADTALTKAAKDIAISKGITLAFAEEGGIAGEVTERTTLKGDRLSRKHKSGRDVLTVLSSEEGILSERRMRNLGGRRGFKNLETILDNPNNDILFPKVPFFTPVKDNKLDRSILNEIKELKQAVINKPVSYSQIDNAGNVIMTTIENGLKNTRKVISRKPRFTR